QAGLRQTAATQPGPPQASATPVRRRTARRDPPAAPAPAETRRGDPAPVPNRDMEGPRRNEASRASPRLDPALIDPAEPRFGTAVDRNSLQAREDRLLRQPAAGARLSLPFPY
uniref:hypothetical protein n=1 Tax=Roseomonas rosulenta TaxID=2748667 RepID=UPI0018DF5038